MNRQTVVAEQLPTTSRQESSVGRLPRYCASSLRFLYSWLDFILTIVLAVTAANIPLLLSKTAVARLPQLAFLDDSWHLDMAFKVQQGIWFGKDTVYSYGPLLQLVNSLAPLMRGLSMGSFFQHYYVFPYCVAILLIFVTSRLLLRHHAVWKRALYILLITVFWQPEDWTRSSFDVFFFALSLTQVHALTQTGKSTIGRGLLTSAPAVIAFLISADTGVFAVAALLIVSVVHLLVFRSDREKSKQIVQYLLFTSVFFLAGVLVVNAIFGGIFDFHFWTNSFAIIDVYRWTLAGPMTHEVKIISRNIALASILICLVAYFWRDSESPSLVRKPVFLISAAIFSLVALQSGIMRSDWGHVVMGLYPGIVLSAAVLMGSESGIRYNWRGDLPVFFALALTAILSGAALQLNLSSIKATFKAVSSWQGLTTSVGCPDGSHYLDQACLTRIDFGRLRAVTDYVDTHTSPAESLLIFPNENIYGDVARRRVSGKILQNCFAVGTELKSLQISSYENERSRIGIYSVDEVAGWQIDEVPNFTRTPEIWLYLQEHYSTLDEVHPGISILQRDDVRAKRWNMHAQIIRHNPFSAAVRNDSIIDLGMIDWPSNADFLKLRVTLSYPFWWRFLKPSRVAFTIRLANGETKVVNAVSQPNHSYDVWLYPWRESELANYFADDSKQWKTAHSQELPEQISLKISRFDSLSVLPSKVTIEKVEAVAVALN